VIKEYKYQRHEDNFIKNVQDFKKKLPLNVNQFLESSSQLIVSFEEGTT